MKDDFKKMAADVAELIRNGKLTQNEARVMLGLAPHPDPSFDEKLIVQLN